jgi:hypothetical protein
LVYQSTIKHLPGVNWGKPSDPSIFVNQWWDSKPGIFLGSHHRWQVFFRKKWASRNGQWENTNNFLSMTPGGEFLGTPLNLPQLSVQQVGQIRKPAMAPSH